MVFRVHGDGRKYIANLRTENWLVGGRSHDVWQAFLFARSASFSVHWVSTMHAGVLHKQYLLMPLQKHLGVLTLVFENVPMHIASRRMQMKWQKC